MQRVQGSSGVALIECINPMKSKWCIRWDVQDDTGTDEQGSPNIGVNYMEREFLYKPTINEIKALILGWHDTVIDTRIISTFVWRDMSIWLSSESQFNYKAIYDIAVQTSGASLPTMFKFGTVEQPQYHTFTTLEELADFYMSSIQYVQKILEDGWLVKDNIDWTPYQQE